MDYTEQDQNNVLKTRTDKEYELVPHGESPLKPVQRIHRSFTIIDKKQSTQTTLPSVNPSIDNKLGTPVTDPNAQQINNKLRKLDDSHPRFGPLLQQWDLILPMTKTAWQLHHAAKKKAWQRVKYGVLGGVAKATKENILVDIRRVEKEARGEYADNFSGTRSDFRMMMLRDGCLFIQMAFMILGKSHVDLGYPLDDPVFGGKAVLNSISGWMEAMFYVGNQIPLVVLKELIKQQFFQDLILKGNWTPPVSDLRKRVLYEQLVLPELDNNNDRRVCCVINLSKHVYRDDEKPCDVLHALQNLVLGPILTDSSTDYRFGEYEGPFEFDLEANDEDGIDEESRFPSAVEMKQVGINIAMLKSGGPRSIRFSSWYFKAYLYLPALPVDADIISVFRSLKTYEISDQRLGKRNREMSSYISLMSDIIQTPQDLSILQKKGIVGGNSYYAEKLPGILRRLNSKDVKLTYNLRNVRHQITNFCSPLVRYQTVINFVVFLTILQAVFAMLAYFKPPKSPT